MDVEAIGQCPLFHDSTCSAPADAAVDADGGAVGDTVIKYTEIVSIDTHPFKTCETRHFIANALR